MSTAQDAPLHVVAAVIRRPDGRVLLAQRPPGKALAGLWEFPGGKREAGESGFDALVRELDEELGLRIEAAEPLIAIPQTQPRPLLLDAWRVTAWRGTPRGREGQVVIWAPDDLLDSLPMPAPDRPIVAALRLPSRYLITPPLPPATDPARIDDAFARSLDAGIAGFQLRLPGWSRPELARLARRVLPRVQSAGARVLLHADCALAAVLGFDGVHLPARLARGLQERPLPRGTWLGVSCHDRSELEHAVAIDADFVTVSPVQATVSHPEAEPLGWPAFAELAAFSPLPVYALGGLGEADLAVARRHGAQGVAAIRAWWPDLV